jgi:AcrR family transcriptional regulator
MSAEERMTQLVSAAVTAFAGAGYAGTTTDEVARIAGVTQPYVIRLFGTKQKLFIAALEHVCDRIEQALRDAAGRTADLETLAGSYRELLAEREVLLVFLHGLAASGEPAVGAVMRLRFGRICELVRLLTGAAAEDVQRFVAKGMLLTVLTALQGAQDVPLDPALADLLGATDLLRTDVA